MLPSQPIKSSDLDKSRMKHGGLLNKHFCKKKSYIPNDLPEIVNFHFSHYKSMETLSYQNVAKCFALRTGDTFFFNSGVYQ